MPKSTTDPVRTPRLWSVWAMVVLLILLVALVAWQTWDGLAHIERMMAERSQTLTLMVSTGVRNVARFGRARLERVDDVLADVASSPDVVGIKLERDDGAVRLIQGELPADTPPLDSIGDAPTLAGPTVLRAHTFRIDTIGCGSCAGCAGCGGGHTASPGEDGGIDGEYRVLLAIDARPYQQLRRTVWTQAGAGALLILLLAASIWLQRRQSRKAAAMGEALAVAEERGRSFERLGLVAGGLAHEIKNPVGSLRGFAQLISEGVEPGSSEAEYAELMISELDGVTRRIDRLRDFARPSPPTLEPGRPVEVVRKVLTLLQPDLEARSIELDLDLPESPGPETAIDGDRFRDLVVNLVTNAVEASPEGGTVAVRLSEAPEGRLVLEVVDGGEGIPASERDRALRPFHSTKPGGLGMGLAVAQQAVEDHGGELELDDAAGGGLVARARWPRR